VPENLVDAALHAAQQLRSEIAAALADGGRGERLRDGLVVAIAGPPNAGKSTLLNRLARREAAIVSPYPGTTRDVIEVHFDLGGYPVTLLDTAGIRDSSDPVEQEGVRRARAGAAAADLVLWVTDASAAGGAVNDSDKNLFKSDVWSIENKIDLAVEKLCIKCESGSAILSPITFSISAATGAGTDALVTALAAFAQNYFSATEPALVTRARHRRALEDTVAALDRALAERSSGREELIAE